MRRPTRAYLSLFEFRKSVILIGQIRHFRYKIDRRKRVRKSTESYGLSEEILDRVQVQNCMVPARRIKVQNHIAPASLQHRNI